ncbi:30S ribosomal protein 3, chloroplastic [Dionaea muscipula]
MLPMAVQPAIHAPIRRSICPFPSLVLLNPIKASTFGNPKSSSLTPFSVSHPKRSRRCTRDTRFSPSVAASSAHESVDAESLEVPSATADDLADLPVLSEKLGVVVSPSEKPRLVLKFIWMEKNIGIALDQSIPGHGTIPLSPYYFWPRKDAWEELKVLLESKPWISQKQMIILLNQATDIINLWQQSGGNLA